MPALNPDLIAIEILPKRTQELVSVIGFLPALKIVELRGGVRLTVPKRLSSDHWLVAHIGITAFERLVQYYNGEEIEIDRCAGALQKIKENVIMDAFENGASNAQLARKYGYTERGIRKLRKRVEQQREFEARQDDLFDL